MKNVRLNSRRAHYPDVDKFSKLVGISADKLVKAFRIEKMWRKKILDTKSARKRKTLYVDVYNKVHKIYGSSLINRRLKGNPKDGIVKLFKKELNGKAVLDVGCGEGWFLKSISKNLKHKELVGIDASSAHINPSTEDIQYIKSDIVKFKFKHRFDVVFSDQVLEHIATADLEIHLRSIREILKPGGLFIVILPNRLFGPSDVTRIIDFSYLGRTPACGTHLNESTYGEMLLLLRKNGFGRMTAPIPVPRLRNVLSNVRINPEILAKIEKSSLLNLLRIFRFHNRPILRLEINLVCQKSGR